MNKTRLNFIVDVFIFLGFVGQAISGFVLWLVLPKGGGFRGGQGVEIVRTFIFDRHTWLNLHDWLAVVLVVGVLIHLILHWKWIVCVTKRMVKDLSRGWTIQKNPEACEVA